jgi:hypothetical protein
MRQKSACDDLPRGMALRRRIAPSFLLIRIKKPQEWAAAKASLRQNVAGKCIRAD